MTLTTRLLGLAFASADTLVEVDPKGVVSFAIGAGAVAGEDAGATWTGRPLLDLLHALIDGLLLLVERLRRLL